MDDGQLGVYLHVPFCERVCPYCDFPVVATWLPAIRRPAIRMGAAGSGGDPAAGPSAEVEARYVAALVTELAERRPRFAGRPLASLYFGGGTPSLLTPESIARLVERTRAAFPAESDLEVTLEVNPSTVERARLPGFRAAGVNRLSVGVQSFDDATLKRLGRAHRAVEARACLAAVREAGFDEVSLDLIYGVPGQALESVERDVAEIAAFAPEHVSAYELSVEERTPYATAVATGKLALPAEEDALAMAETVGQGLAGAGLPAYEISSHARPGHESVHNRRYWQRRAVLGLGMGAWSCEPARPGAPHGARRANPRNLSTYLERVEGGRPACAGAEEVLDSATARGEAAFLALRTETGLAAAAFAAEFGAPPRAHWADAIDELCSAGLLAEQAGGDLRLTPEGRRLSDSVFARFV